MTKLVFISDTHTRFGELTISECDILIDSGDYSFKGTNSEIKNFYKWFDKQPAKHLISVQGNHELGFEANPENAIAIAKSQCERVHLLHDSGVTINGIKFWGSPWQPEFCDWAYNLPRGLPLKEKWALIPDDTNVLITHGPPYQILDDVQNMWEGRIESVGCMALRSRTSKLDHLKFHSFGHIHLMGSKQMKVGNTTFINASICDEGYKATNKPVEIDYENI